MTKYIFQCSSDYLVFEEGTQVSPRFIDREHNPASEEYTQYVQDTSLKIGCPKCLSEHLWYRTVDVDRQLDMIDMPTIEPIPQTDIEKIVAEWMSAYKKYAPKLFTPASTSFPTLDVRPVQDHYEECIIQELKDIRLTSAQILVELNMLNKYLQQMFPLPKNDK